MAQIKLLKIAADGVPLEMDSASDEIQLLSGQFGNVLVSGNDITAQDTDGNINLVPDGTGNVVLSGQEFPNADGTDGQFLRTDGAGALYWADQDDDLEAERVVNNYLADGAVALVDALYISGSGTVAKAQAQNDGANSRLMGFAQNAAADTEEVEVASEGVLDGFTGLTPGARYYLSAATAGEIVSSVPSGTGNTIVQAGYSKSATELHIHIQQLGRRA